LITIWPDSLDDLLKSLSVVIFGGLFIVLTGRYLKIKNITALLLYFWHLLFSFVYMTLAARNGGDAVGYYIKSFDSFVQFDLGTNAIVYIVSWLTVPLGLSFLGTSLVFNVIGSLGLLFFFAALREAKQGMHWVFWLLLFLPSVSLWSSGLGKDPLSFFATAMFSWAMVSGQLRVMPVVISLVVMGLARPHIAVVLAGAAALAGVIQFKQSPIKSIASLLACAGGGLYLLPIVMQKMQLDSLNLDDIGGVLEGREGRNMMGGSSIDITGMPLYLKIFTYLFRPLPTDATDALQLLNSFENILLLVIFVGGLFIYVSRIGRGQGWQFFPLLLVSLILILFLSQITANLGIAVRQKWMAFVPLLIVLAAAMRVQQQRSRPQMPYPYGYQHR
jgi:hypothetical protein